MAVDRRRQRPHTADGQNETNSGLEMSERKRKSTASRAKQRKKKDKHTNTHVWHGVRCAVAEEEAERHMNEMNSGQSTVVIREVNIDQGARASSSPGSFAYSLDG